MLCAGNFFFSGTDASEMSNALIDRFLHEELGWLQSKVDDLLVPIIQKMGKRGQVRWPFG